MQSEIITLNVGGTVYAATRSTLSGPMLSEFADARSRATGTYFNQLFGGRFAPKLDKDGHVFIDRDGELFKYVLRALRNRSVAWEKLGVPDHLTEAVIAELDFFQVSSENEIRRMLRETNELDSRVCGRIPLEYSATTGNFVASAPFGSTLPYLDSNFKQYVGTRKY